MDARSDRMIMREIQEYEKSLRKQGYEWPQIYKMLKARKIELIFDWKKTFDIADDLFSQFTDKTILNGRLAVIRETDITVRSQSEIDRARNWIVVSYYTCGTGYEEEYRYFLRSLKRFSLSYYVEGIRNLGSWQTNTHYKARFIKRMLESLKMPVVFIDIDAAVKKYPLLFDFMTNEDMAAFFKSNEYDLLSGTMFWNYTEPALNLLGLWIEKNKGNISCWEQKVLSDILNRMEDRPKIFRLPIEYCSIYDSKQKVHRPVIEHHQCSRRFWKSVQSGEKSRARIAILTPTRDRPDNVRRLVRSAIGMADNPERIKFYFLVHPKIESSVPKDIQDDMHRYICLISRPIPDIVNLSALWNEIYKKMAEDADLYGFYGDDAEFRTKGWDSKVEAVFDAHCGQPHMVRTNDHFQKDKAVLFFTNRHFHDIVGFYMPEEYHNVAMDEFWHKTAKEAGCYTYLENVDTYHHSCAITGRAQKDATHDRARTKVGEDLALFTSPEEKKRRKNLALMLKKECENGYGCKISNAAKLPQRICIVIPYYESAATGRAARTWTSPDTVFAMTDKDAIPPDDVSIRTYLGRNATEAGLSSRKKPYLLDILRAAREKIPDAGYYIYANGDIILPPGLRPVHLLPRDGKAAAVHHRQEMKSGYGTELIPELVSSKDWQVGKDVFALRADVMDEMLRSMGDVIVGACNWDDGLACWLWMKYGFNNVELRYGEVSHQFHGYKWNGNDPDAKHNAAELDKAGIHTLSQKLGDWDLIFKKAKSNGFYKANPEKIGILQPGRLGDIVIVLPIAKRFYSLGYIPVWPMPSRYLDLFSHYIPYANAVNIDREGTGYKACMKILNKMGIEKKLDLAIGFGGGADKWNDNESFDAYKYRVSRIDLNEKYGLEIIRNPKREKLLRDKLKIGENYVVTHSSSSFARHNFGIGNAVEVRPIEGFCLFDWIGIIADAKELWCADSCVANLANQLGLCKGRRHFRPWHERYNEKDMTRLTPQLADGWEIII